MEIDELTEDFHNRSPESLLFRGQEGCGLLVQRAEPDGAAGSSLSASDPAETGKTAVTPAVVPCK